MVDLPVASSDMGLDVKFISSYLVYCYNSRVSNIITAVDAVFPI